MIVRFLIILLVLVAVDLYFFQAVKTVSSGLSADRRNLVNYIYWILCTVLYIMVVITAMVGQHNIPKLFRTYVFSVFLIMELSKILGIVFLLFDDVYRLIRFATETITRKENTRDIGRLKFLSVIALGISAIPFISLVRGMVSGAYNYQVKKIKLKLQNLPAEFEGLKIVQISDIHTGSFLDTKHLNEAFDLILAQKPDVIFFTGDLVNDVAKETIGFEDVYKKLNAPLGVFSTLGNHDYGDYTTWDSIEAKQANLEQLKSVHKNAGWKLLMNENHIIERNGKQLAIIGIENWGANLRFPKYGKLDKAVIGSENAAVKLLLSHDPSHWEGEVVPKYPDIDVMFAGHTHGMQFGVEIPGFKWSPAQYFYKQWAGLYQAGQQQLYVNRGLGFIGYPGRVGILPEISVFELTNS
jgi:predicted MPP superfamily phosphohydrolase